MVFSSFTKNQQRYVNNEMKRREYLLLSQVSKNCLMLGAGVFFLWGDLRPMVFNRMPMKMEEMSWQMVCSSGTRRPSRSGPLLPDERRSSGFFPDPVHPFPHRRLLNKLLYKLVFSGEVEQ